MNFCDFCPCEECRTGGPSWHMLEHALTSDGRWICDVCYLYSVCLKSPERKGKGPCKERDCVHRPKIVGMWTKKEDDIDKGA